MAIGTFFLPYIQFCHIAAWGIAQNLEGLGLFGFFNNVPEQVGQYLISPLNLNPQRGVWVISALTLLMLIYCFVSSVRAGFYLRRSVGVFLVALWLIPGVAAVLGFNTFWFFSGPDVFRFNVGFSGSVESAAANLFLFLIAGWSTVMMLGVRWKRDVFKNAYDHLWYALGLVAALYFVTDSGVPSYKHDLDDATQRLETLLEVYATASQGVESACATDPFVRVTAPALCAVIPKVANGIKRDRELERSVRPSLDLSDWTEDLRNPAVALDVDRLTQLACGAPLRCHRFKAEVALDDVAYLRGHAFPPNTYLNSFPKYRSAIIKADEKIKSTERGHNLRYFAFLMVAFLAGGKVANASRALRLNDRLKPESWTVIFLRSIYWICRQIHLISWFGIRKGTAFAIERIGFSSKRG